MSDPVLIHAGNARIAGRKWGIDPAVILGLLSVEGGTSADGKPVAPGDGAGPPSFGQFTFGTGASLGVKFGDSASETDAIGRYLTQLGYADNPERALARYNGGSDPPPVSWTYAQKVLTAAKRYAGAGGTSPASTATSSGTDSSAIGGTDTSSSAGGLFGETERSGAVRALTYTALTLAGATLAALGLSRAAGLRKAAV